MPERVFWDVSWWCEYPVYRDLFELASHAATIGYHVVFLFLMCVGIIVSVLPCVLTATGLYMIYEIIYIILDDYSTLTPPMIHTVTALSIIVTIYEIVFRYERPSKTRGQFWVGTGICTMVLHVLALCDMVTAGTYSVNGLPSPKLVAHLVRLDFGYMTWMQGHDILCRDANNAET